MSTKLRDSLKHQGSLVRPRFAPGILLLDEDLTATVDYTRGLSRLLFRSLFGCGVVCGFEVIGKSECGNVSVTIQPGVALDPWGDPIEMCSEATLGINCGQVPRGTVKRWVVIRRTQKDHACAPRDVVCPSEDDASPHENTRIKDCFELKLLDKLPPYACGCTRPIIRRATNLAVESAAPNEAVSGRAAGVSPATGGESTSGTADGAASGTDRTISVTGAPTPSGTTTTPPASTGDARRAADAVSPRDFRDWDCHRDHYCGQCQECGCVGDGSVVLAELTITMDTAEPKVMIEHGVRRFIRPVMAADPLASRNETLRMACKEGRETPRSELTAFS